MTTTQTTPIPDLTSLTLYQLARRIRAAWPTPYFGAVPYLDAMSSLTSIHDNYGADSARAIVAYFLSNATTWRGPEARAIKAELNRRLNEGKR